MSNGHFIREWRRSRGLTLEQLAERAGVGKAVISRVERGEQRYNQQLLEQFAEALGCAPGDLITRNPEMDIDPLQGLDTGQRELIRQISNAIRYSGMPKTIPYDYEAESALIGAVLAESDPGLMTWLYEALPADAFSRKMHDVIWLNMAAEAERDAPSIDPVTVAKRLAEFAPLQEAGGAAYLADLMDRAPGRSKIPALAGRLLELCVQRALSGAE